MPHPIELLPTPAVHNFFYHWVGLGILSLNSMRHRIRGYRTPRPVMTTEPQEAFRYSRAVVKNWLSHRSHYHGGEAEIDGLDILELGPGNDLGTGMLLLAMGAKSYTAVDAHPLFDPKQAERHRGLAAVIADEMKLSPEEREELLELSTHPGKDTGRLRYFHRPRFNLDVLAKKSFDLILSHSSLEHVRHFDKTAEQLGRCARSQADFVAEIDLQTHTRWLRDHDPLNIYRYNNPLYQSLSFSGSPNRVRPDEFVEDLENAGWTNPRFYPRRVLDAEYVHRVEPSLADRFRGDPERLGWMSFVLCAQQRKQSRFEQPEST